MADDFVILGAADKAGEWCFCGMVGLIPSWALPPSEAQGFATAGRASVFNREHYLDGRVCRRSKAQAAYEARKTPRT